MSNLSPLAEPCEVCGDPSVARFPDENGSNLCGQHLKEFKWRDALAAEAAEVIKTWQQGHKLTDAETERVVQVALDSSDAPVSLISPPKPSRTDHFIECNINHPALVLSYFHLLKDTAVLAGFEDVWITNVHLKVEISGDEHRLGELQKRIDELWLGAWLSESERTPVR